MKLWWLTCLARFTSEKKAIEALERDAEWLSDVRWAMRDGLLVVEATVRSNDVDYRLKLVYPDQFPLVPAWVAPLDDGVKWSDHQFGPGGSLCLEIRPDNWHPDATGAQLIESAHRLLNAENPLGSGARGQVVNAHQAAGAQTYVQGANPVLIGAGCLARVRAGDAAGLAGVRWWPDDDIWPIYLFDEEDRRRDRPPPEGNVRSWRTTINAVAVVGEADHFPDKAWLDERLAAGAGPTLEYPAVILVATADECVPFHCPDAETLVRRQLIVIPDDAGVRSGRAASASGRKVAIVGVGSVGSKMAESLVRSGIRDIVLVDGDVFLPANVERHALDWRDVGFSKARAMKRRLLEIAPNVNVEVVDQNLFWQQSAKNYGASASKIAEADVIVDASGDVPTGLFVAALASANRRAFVSVQVFEGGIGAAIARALPGRDPPFVYSLNAFASYCEQRDVRPPKSGTKTYEALTEDGAPFVADDAAVSIASAHGARTVLDILDGAITTADKAWLLVGMRRAWLFEKHGHVISLDVGGPPAEPAQDDTAQDPAIAGFAVAIAKGEADAAANPA